MPGCRSNGFLLAGLLLTPMAGGLAAATLAENSPFLPPGWVAPATRAETAPPPVNAAPQQQFLQFKGVYALGEALFVHIFNLRDQQGTWVRLNDPQAAFLVDRYDARAQAIHLTFEGRALRLVLAQPNPQMGGASPAVARVLPQTAQTQRTEIRRRILPPSRRDVVRRPDYGGDRDVILSPRQLEERARNNARPNTEIRRVQVGPGSAPPPTRVIPGTTTPAPRVIPGTNTPAPRVNEN